MTERPTIYWRASLMVHRAAEICRALAYRLEALELRMVKLHIHAWQRKSRFKRAGKEWKRIA